MEHSSATSDGGQNSRVRLKPSLQPIDEESIDIHDAQSSSETDHASSIEQTKKRHKSKSKRDKTYIHKKVKMETKTDHNAAQYMLDKENVAQNSSTSKEARQRDTTHALISLSPPAMVTEPRKKIKPQIISNIKVDYNLLYCQSNPGTSKTYETVPQRKANEDDASENSAYRDPISQKFKEKVIMSLEKLQVTCDQNQIMLCQILKTMQYKPVDVGIEKPEDIMSFPLHSTDDFDKLEKQLKKTAYTKYLTKRLAALGAPTLRLCVMGMMRYVMTNKLGMEFNWAGRNNKLSFQRTRLMNVILAATKLTVQYDVQSDSTDHEIARAVKDWLKQSKARNSYASATAKKSGSETHNSNDSTSGSDSDSS